eukprot:sb/3461743/
MAVSVLIIVQIFSISSGGCTGRSAHPVMQAPISYCIGEELTETNKQPIRTRYLGHVTGNQLIRKPKFQYLYNFSHFVGFQGSSNQETGDTADSNYTRCAAGLVLDIGTHWLTSNKYQMRNMLTSISRERKLQSKIVTLKTQFGRCNEARPSLPDLKFLYPNRNKTQTFSKYIQAREMGTSAYVRQNISVSVDLPSRNSVSSFSAVLGGPDASPPLFLDDPGAVGDPFDDELSPMQIHEAIRASRSARRGDTEQFESKPKSVKFIVSYFQFIACKVTAEVLMCTKYQYDMAQLKYYYIFLPIILILLGLLVSSVVITYRGVVERPPVQLQRGEVEGGGEGDTVGTLRRVSRSDGRRISASEMPTGRMNSASELPTRKLTSLEIAVGRQFSTGRRISASEMGGRRISASEMRATSPNSSGGGRRISTDGRRRSDQCSDSDSVRPNLSALSNGVWRRHTGETAKDLMEKYSAVHQIKTFMDIHQADPTLLTFGMRFLGNLCTDERGALLVCSASDDVAVTVMGTLQKPQYMKNHIVMVSYYGNHTIHEEPHCHGELLCNSFQFRPIKTPPPPKQSEGYRLVGMIAKMNPVQGTLIRQHECKWTNHVTRSLFEMKEFPDLIENGVMSLTYFFSEETGGNYILLHGVLTFYRDLLTRHHDNIAIQFYITRLITILANRETVHAILTQSVHQTTVDNMKRFSDDPRLVTACTDFLQTVCGLVAEQLSPDPGDPNDSAFATDRAHMTSLKNATLAAVRELVRSEQEGDGNGEILFNCLQILLHLDEFTVCDDEFEAQRWSDFLFHLVLEGFCSEDKINLVEVSTYALSRVLTTLISFTNPDQDSIKLHIVELFVPRTLDIFKSCQIESVCQAVYQLWSALSTTSNGATDSNVTSAMLNKAILSGDPIVSSDGNKLQLILIKLQALQCHECTDMFGAGGKCKHTIQRETTHIRCH